MKKILIIGAQPNQQSDIELRVRQKLGNTVEVVFADTGTADKTIHVSEIETVNYELTQRPNIPHIVFEPDVKERRKGHQRPYKYHK